MDTSNELDLIPTVVEPDAMGQQIRKEQPPVHIFCREKSVSREEWDTAIRNSLKSEFKLIIAADEYHGETLALYKGQRYTIYRTWNIRGTDDLEIYLGRRAGV